MNNKLKTVFDAASRLPPEYPRAVRASGPARTIKQVFNGCRLRSEEGSPGSA